MKFKRLTRLSILVWWRPEWSCHYILGGGVENVELLAPSFNRSTRNAYVCLCVTQAKILISKCIAIVKFLGIEIEIGMVFSRADSIISWETFTYLLLAYTASEGFNKTQYLSLRLCDSDFNALWVLSECSDFSLIDPWPWNIKIDCSRQTSAGQTDKQTL